MQSVLNVRMIFLWKLNLLQAVTRVGGVPLDISVDDSPTKSPSTIEPIAQQADLKPAVTQKITHNFIPKNEPENSESPERLFVGLKKGKLFIISRALKFLKSF